MHRAITATSFALLLAVTGAGYAGPVTLSDARMDSVSAGQASMNPYEAITADNPAFDFSGLGSIENIHNPDLRFGQGGAIAIPGQGGFHANPRSAFDLPDRPDLVRPRGHN